MRLFLHLSPKSAVFWCQINQTSTNSSFDAHILNNITNFIHITNKLLSEMTFSLRSEFCCDIVKILEYLWALLSVHLSNVYHPPNSVKQWWDVKSLALIILFCMIMDPSAVTRCSKDFRGTLLFHKQSTSVKACTYRFKLHNFLALSLMTIYTW